MLCRILPAFALVQMLGACAVGNTYDYASANPNLTAETQKTVSATVVDHRPYVLSGNKSPAFVGLQRGGFGNPFDVTTKSGRALADDLTDGLVRALAAKGIDAKPLPLSPGTGADKALAQFATAGTDRLLMVVMREWKTDAMMRLTLHWTLDATVYDRTGSTIASHGIAGVAPVADVAFDLEAGKSSVAIQQVSQKLAELLNQPGIVAALR